jgi:hypothetical protein
LLRKRVRKNTQRRDIRHKDPEKAACSEVRRSSKKAMKLEQSAVGRVMGERFQS